MIILDLCGGTGAWSRPYKEAGYDVRLITLPDNDILTYEPPDNVYGILAAPPCTMFSFARTKSKKPRDLEEGMKTVRRCLDIIWKCMETKQDTRYKTVSLKFWALENPNGFLKYFLGKPALEFDPWEYGDNYQKKTHIWGWFNNPIKSVYDKPNVSKFGGDKSIEFRFDKVIKSITPPGFAKAFYEANK
jgi:hypothetical protein